MYFFEFVQTGKKELEDMMSVSSIAIGVSSFGFFVGPV